MRTLLIIVVAILMPGCSDKYGVTDDSAGYYEEVNIVGYFPKLDIEFKRYHADPVDDGYLLNKDKYGRIEYIERYKNSVIVERIFFLYDSCTYRLVVFFVKTKGSADAVAVERSSGGDKGYRLKDGIIYRSLEDITENNFYYDRGEMCYWDTQTSSGTIRDQKGQTRLKISAHL